MEPIERALSGFLRKQGSKARPHITLTYAQSLDGSISARRGRPLALSGPESTYWTHRLRALHDAILVGIGTVLSDDPWLTVRLVEGSSPRPVVLDSQLRIPLEANLLKGQSGTSRPPIIGTTPAAPASRAEALEAAGGHVLILPATAEERVSLPELLERLSDLEIKSVMVEGGAGVITSFLSQGLVDTVVLTIAPIFVGGLKAVEELVGGEIAPAGWSFPRLKDWDCARVGEDLVLWGQPAGPAEADSGQA
jgi:GTP cyclohydrolase II